MARKPRRGGRSRAADVAGRTAAAHAPGRRGGPPWARLWATLETGLVLGGLLVFGAWVARMPILTPDVWWHLATGRWIAQHGVPHQDPFSWTLAGRAWTAHEWLADRLLFALQDAAGLLGVVYARAACMTAAFALAWLAVRRHTRGPLVLALLVLAAWASQRNWLDRPQLATYVLLALELLVLEAHRTGRRWAVWLLPVLTALWVNLHGGFMLGLVLAALWLLAWASERPRAAGRWRLAFVALGVTATATLLNPNFIDGATYPLRYVGSGLRATLQEEQTGRLDSGYAWAHFALVLAALGVLGLRWRRVPRPHLVWVGALAALSMPRLFGWEVPGSAERHAPLFLIGATPVLAWHLPRARWAANAGAPGAGRVARLRLGIATFVLAALGGATAAMLAPRDGSPEARLLPGRYPVRAVAWLREHPLPGRLLNPYRWGGYVMFHLGPEVQVWIDSRGDLYDPETLRRMQLLQRMPPGSDREVQALLRDGDVNVVLWHLLTLDFGPLQPHPLALWLLRSPEWRLVYWDPSDPRHPERPAGVSAVFLREHPRNRAWLEKLPAQPLPPLPGAPRQRSR